MSSELGTSRYNSAYRRYQGKRIAKPITQTNSDYTEATYLGYDPAIGKHKYQTKKGIVTATNLSNTPTALDSTVIYSQGFSVTPY